MPSSAILRVASRTQPVCFFRTASSATRKLSPSRSSGPRSLASPPIHTFHTSTRTLSSPHGEETFEQFSTRYENEFNNVQDVFELQRNLNNSFAYDLVPSLEVCSAALRAARRVNDFPTAVRILEGIKIKVENKGQYMEYLQGLEDLRKELGVDLAEELYPDPKYRAPRW